MIKISILKDPEDPTKFAYMEYQSGNDPKVYNDTYGSSGFWDLGEVGEEIIKCYKDEVIMISVNI